MYRKSKKLISTLVAAVMTLGVSTIGVNAAEVTTTSASPASSSQTLSTNRLWGSDRYETAIAISKANWKASDYVVIARGDDFPDALCAAPLAKKYNAPILLTSKANLSPDVTAEVKRLAPKQIFITGGEGAVSKEVSDALSKIAPVERIYGSDRYATSVKVAQKLGSVSKVVIATGDTFADALSIAPIAAKDGMPILLSGKNALPADVSNYLSTQNITASYVVGGEGVLSKNIEKSLNSSTRLSGTDRYETNLAILKAFESELKYDSVYVAAAYNDQDGFADALAGSALAAVKSAPVVLTDKTLSSNVLNYLKTKLSANSQIISLGGQAVVAEDVVNSIVSSYTATQTQQPTNTPTSTPTNNPANSTTFSTAGTYGSTDASKPQDLTDSVSITAANVTLQNATAEKDLTVKATGASLNNVTVKGTLYLDPGADGTATLNKVTAANVVVLSGASHSINVVDSTFTDLSVTSTTDVRVAISGTTVIQSTTVSSSAILATSSGTFGQVNVVPASSGASVGTVQFAGSFSDPVTVSGSATLSTASDTAAPKVTVSTPNPTDTVTFAGTFRAVVVTSIGNLVLGPSATIRDTLTLNSGAAVSADPNARVSQVVVSPVSATASITLTGTVFGLVNVTNPASLSFGANSEANVVANCAGIVLTAPSTAKIALDSKTFTVDKSAASSAVIATDLSSVVSAIQNAISAAQALDSAQAALAANPSSAAAQAAVASAQAALSSAVNAVNSKMTSIGAVSAPLPTPAANTNNPSPAGGGSGGSGGSSSSGGTTTYNYIVGIKHNNVSLGDPSILALGNTKATPTSTTLANAFSTFTANAIAAYNSQTYYTDKSKAINAIKNSDLKTYIYNALIAKGHSTIAEEFNDNNYDVMVAFLGALSYNTLVSSAYNTVGSDVTIPAGGIAAPSGNKLVSAYIKNGTAATPVYIVGNSTTTSAISSGTITVASVKSAFNVSSLGSMSVGNLFNNTSIVFNFTNNETYELDFYEK